MQGDVFTHDGLVLERFELGPFGTNCFIVHAEGEPPAVIDCGIEPEQLLARLDALRASGAEAPNAFVLTHAHMDHIGGLRAARSRFPGVPIWIHEAEREWLVDPRQNLSEMAGIAVTAPAADRLLEDGETLTLAGRAWEVCHVPGHSPGSIALCCEAAGVAIVGDALFRGSVGRTDFPGSSMETLSRSIREKLYTLAASTVIYPGHGPASTIGEEMATNPFVPAG